MHSGFSSICFSVLCDEIFLPYLPTYHVLDKHDEVFSEMTWNNENYFQEYSLFLSSGHFEVFTFVTALWLYSFMFKFMQMNFACIISFFLFLFLLFIYIFTIFCCFCVVLCKEKFSRFGLL